MKMLRGLIAFGLLLLYGVSPGTADQNSVSTWQMKRLAFESRIWNVNLRGSSVEQGEISVLSGTDFTPRVLARGEAPAWSPDGEKLAFCTRAIDGFGQIQIINADGSGKKQITKIKGGACFPDWSPNGERIAFTAFGGKSPTVDVVDNNGENLRSVTEGFGPRWSADSKRLVFYRSINRKNTSSAIWIINADGTGASEVVKEDAPPPAAESLGQARFFDASNIVYSYKDNNKSSIFRASLVGVGVQKIAENEQMDLFDPAFAPDGNQLIAQGLSRANSASPATGPIIVFLDLSSRQLTRLTNGRSPSVVWDNRATPGGTSSSAPAPGTSTLGNQSPIAQGKTRYADYKCGDCHGANGEGGPDGPDLTTTYMDAGMISRFLERPSPDAYMKGMPNIPATQPDNQELVAYVVSLKVPVAPPKSDSPIILKLSATEKSHILDGEFTIEKTVDHLPDSLKSAFAHLAKEADFKMANPGEKYLEGDVVIDAGLPWRRLFFAGISKNRYFIHYEKGGRAHSYLLAVFDVDAEGKVSLLWSVSGTRGAKDLADLRALLSSKAFVDSDSYW